MFPLTICIAQTASRTHVTASAPHEVHSGAPRNAVAHDAIDGDSATAHQARLVASRWDGFEVRAILALPAAEVKYANVATAYATKTARTAVGHQCWVLGLSSMTCCVLLMMTIAINPVANAVATGWRRKTSTAASVQYAATIHVYPWWAT